MRKQFVQGGRNIVRLAHSALRNYALDRSPVEAHAVLPEVLQFPVNDICNSRCVMCNIWQRKRDREITPTDLEKILRNELFQRIRYVGISGGEPTLRRDLAAIGEVLTKSLPRLRGVGIISNGLREQAVVTGISSLGAIIRNAGKNFNVTISLDGVGEIHDRNRGMPGNFASSVKVIEQTVKAGFPLTIGCTITPLNCDHVDDLLLWCDDHGIAQSEFRVGVEINRLYNANYSEAHHFTREQRFHLVGFFRRLCSHPRTDIWRRIFYASLADQLAYGRARRAGCAWKKRAVTLDSRGDLSFCSVKSPVLGSALAEPAEQIYVRSKPIRDGILENSCDSCQHDLMGPLETAEAAAEIWKIGTKPLRAVANRLRPKLRAVAATTYAITGRPKSPVGPQRWNKVLITGWYGTETAGDKAILGELLHFIEASAPGCRVAATSFDKWVSAETAVELGQGDMLQTVGWDEALAPRFLDDYDAVIIGGGPLEELVELEKLWVLFQRAAGLGKERIIFGCGIGPLHTTHNKVLADNICRLATGGFLRDRESQQYAAKVRGDQRLPLGCDPALAYVDRWRQAHQGEVREAGERTIVAMLRALTSEYAWGLDRGGVHEANLKVAQTLGEILAKLHDTGLPGLKSPFDLLAMHACPTGGDDRLFNRQVAKFAGGETICRVERKYLPLDQVLARISGASLALPMRYHGHVFCVGLGVPFVSIDYTGTAGKIGNLLRRAKLQDLSEKWTDLGTSKVYDGLVDVFGREAQVREQVQRARGELLSDLQSAYRTGFHSPAAR